MCCERKGYFRQPLGAGVEPGATRAGRDRCDLLSGSRPLDRGVLEFRGADGRVLLSAAQLSCGSGIPGVPDMLVHDDAS